MLVLLLLGCAYIWLKLVCFVCELTEEMQQEVQAIRENQQKFLNEAIAVSLHPLCRCFVFSCFTLQIQVYCHGFSCEE